MKFEPGDHVKWEWGSGVAEGSVTEVHTSTVTKTIKGAEVTRHGSETCPAYTIKQDDGDVVLKLESELS